MPKKTGEYINVGKDPNFAEYFSSVGYKKYFPEDEYKEAQQDYIPRIIK